MPRRKKVVKDKSDTNTVNLSINSINNKYGANSIVLLSSQSKVKVETVSSGSIGLDKSMGVGGFPKGRITEIFGPEMSGKTTIALHTIASCNKQGKFAAFIDVEHAFDPIYAEALGVDFTLLFFSQPNSGEEALNIAEDLVRSKSVDVVVLDSVASLIPKQELEGNIGDSFIGLQARLMSQALRKLVPITSKSKTCLIFINQLRSNIASYGSSETTTGGRALKFYSSVRLDVRRISLLKHGDSIIGNRTRVKVVKNKVASPFKECEFDILYGTGISREGELIDLAEELNILEKSGAWYKYEGSSFAQGKEQARQKLNEYPELFEEIKVKVLKLID